MDAENRHSPYLCGAYGQGRACACPSQAYSLCFFPVLWEFISTQDSGWAVNCTLLSQISGAYLSIPLTPSFSLWLTIQACYQFLYTFISALYKEF